MVPTLENSFFFWGFQHLKAWNCLSHSLLTKGCEWESTALCVVAAGQTSPIAASSIRQIFRLVLESHIFHCYLVFHGTAAKAEDPAPLGSLRGCHWLAAIPWFPWWDVGQPHSTGVSGNLLSFSLDPAQHHEPRRKQWHCKSLPFLILHSDFLFLSPNVPTVGFSLPWISQNCRHAAVSVGFNELCAH